MWQTFVLFYLVCSANADYLFNETTAVQPRCSDTPGTTMTFTPVEGIIARYSAELCTESKLTSKEWQLDLLYHNKPGYCNSSNTYRQIHSMNTEWISSNHNCTENQTVCMSVLFDLIFSACYSLKSEFLGDNSLHPSTYYFNVTNYITEEQIHKKFLPDVAPTYPKDYISISWFPGVPLLAYEVSLWNISDGSKLPVDKCESADPLLIKCELRLPNGCYKMEVRHIAPWIGGIFTDKEIGYHTFCRNVSGEVSVEAQSAGAVWAWAGLGAAAALLAAAGAALLARRSRAGLAFQKSVLQRSKEMWEAREEAAEVLAVKPKHVLLLYARENAIGNKAIAALREALEYLVEGKVYDIFSPATMCLCAAGPGGWAREALQAGADTRVLLLQSPALLALHAARPRCSAAGLQLASPLLGRRVVPRAPAFGDSLLQYCLRALTEDARAQGDYRNYYVATLSSLPTEAIPGLVPYRRYALPDAAELLLKDITQAPAVPRPLLDNFTRALQEFVDYATENPNYLMDELIVVDS